MATARKPEQLADLQTAYGENIRALALDVTNEAQARKAFEAAISSFGSLDVLVNNAGFGNVSGCKTRLSQTFVPRSKRTFLGSSL